MRAPASRPAWLIPFIVSLIVVTRVAAVLTGYHVPNATLPAMFLAGRGGLGGRWLLALLLLSGGLDAAFFAVGVSAACVSPAYPMLFLAYGAMWFCGRLAMRPAGIARRGAPAPARLSSATLGLFLMGVVLAFALSSGGYYALSGKFEQPTLAGFAPRAARYFPRYLLYALLYGAICEAMLALLWRPPHAPGGRVKNPRLS